MAALWIGQAIILSSCGFYLLLSFFFPRLISAVGDWCLPYFHTRCGLSVNLECRSEIAARGSLKNTGRKNYAKNRHLGTIAQGCLSLSGYIFAIKACIDTRKKSVKHQFLIYMSLQYGELRPTSGWDRFVSLGHPNKFQRVSRLGFVTAAKSLNGGHQTLHDVWPSPGLIHYRRRHLYSAGWPSRWALTHI